MNKNLNKVKSLKGDLTNVIVNGEGDGKTLGLEIKTTNILVKELVKLRRKVLLQEKTIENLKGQNDLFLNHKNLLFQECEELKSKLQENAAIIQEQIETIEEQDRYIGELEKDIYSVQMEALNYKRKILPVILVMCFYLSKFTDIFTI